jgi:hypothetical protein
MHHTFSARICNGMFAYRNEYYNCLILMRCCTGVWVNVACRQQTTAVSDGASPERSASSCCEPSSKQQ